MDEILFNRNVEKDEILLNIILGKIKGNYFIKVTFNYFFHCYLILMLLLYYDYYVSNMLR